MTGVDEDPEEWVAEVLVDDRLKRTAGLADAERGIPRADRGEIRADEPIEVVADRVGELVSVLDHEPGAAGQRTPDPEGGGERVAAFDRPIARTEQAERGARAGREHQVAGQRPAVPTEQRHRLALAHARPDPAEERAHALRGVAACPLEGGELLDLVDDAHSIGRIDEEVGRVLDRAAAPDGRAELVHDVGGHVAHPRIRVRLPPAEPDATSDFRCPPREGSRRAASSDLAAASGG